MSLCSLCGMQVVGMAALCPHHHYSASDSWSRGNRIMCDFFHRKIVPPRVEDDGEDILRWS